MEPNVEIFLPSRQYARVGWAALAGSLVCVLCGFGAPLAFIPALLCATTAAAIFWLAARPPIRLGETQFNIGERSIAWREVREMNRSRFNQFWVCVSARLAPEADQRALQVSDLPGRS